MSNSDVLVSVIIPTYGRPEKLAKAIDSVIQESVEVIVVDDNGSGTVNQELTSECMLQYRGLSNVVYCLLPDNVGACKARNHGVSIAKSAVVAFLDDDDLCIAGALMEKAQYFLGEGEADFCCSNMLVRREGRNFKTHFSDFKGVERKEYLISGNCYTPMIMAKKEAFLDIGGFSDTVKYQDHVLMLKAHLKSKTIVHFNMVTFIHNEHGGERITNGKTKARHKVRTKYEDMLFNELMLTAKEKSEFLFSQDKIQYLEQSLGQGILSNVFDWRIAFGKHILKKSYFFKSIYMLAYSLLPDELGERARRALYYREIKN